MNFADLGLSADLLKALEEKGYREPSPVQAKAIPPVLDGRDVIAAAQTGTGKTAGFTLPVLHLLSETQVPGPRNIRALILTPTRELAAQVGASVDAYGKYLDLKSTVVFGGVKIGPQISRLRRGVDILVATPGRLLDLYQQRALDFSKLEIFVLDEADRMLDMGFIPDIRRILKLLPTDRQSLMFSATFTDEVRKLVNGIVTDPIEISVAARNTTAQTVTQWLCPVDKRRKSELLNHLIWEQKWEQVLVFSRTKHGANKLATYLEKQGVETAAIHGNKSQGARTKALSQFKNGKIRALVATDIAARGLDIHQLPHVVNFDLPNVPEDYVHRIGRTGRAGADGEAISLVSADEIKQLVSIERLIAKLIDRRYVDGFEPEHELPESRLQSRRPAREGGQRDERRQGGRGNGRGRGSEGRPAKSFRSDERGQRFEDRDNQRGRGGDRNRGGDRFEERGNFKARGGDRRRDGERFGDRDGYQGRSDRKPGAERFGDRDGYQGRSDRKPGAERFGDRDGFKGRGGDRSRGGDRYEDRDGFKGRGGDRSRGGDRYEDRGNFKGRGGDRSEDRGFNHDGGERRQSRGNGGRSNQEGRPAKGPRAHGQRQEQGSARPGSSRGNASPRNGSGHNGSGHNGSGRNGSGRNGSGRNGSGHNQNSQRGPRNSSGRSRQAAR